MKTRLDRSANHAFMQVKCVPLGGVDRYHQVLVVENVALPVSLAPVPAVSRPAPHKAVKR